ncbi:hypothetical protein Pint_34702 [Pistacia integerrima]|uniref:Uncharacterized protein n=1 Tax=Pistacia integerrima TaxID=434235 RepID=A0ACC0X4A4_9ROSI|nr:hypothetical protein Pint_34702 [Pistacia integerrima]
MAMKSKILIIGGTGYIGKFIVEASAKAGHPTFVLVRESTLSSPSKSEIVENFKSLSVNLLIGDLQDHESLVKAIEQVEVVISTLSRAQLVDQVKIIAAIKEAGNVKRFFPSEFGNDVDRVHPVEPAKTAFATKAKIRRLVEAEGIPYTYVSCNGFANSYLSNFSQPGAKGPPRDKVFILGDGNPKVIYNKEDDVATYTIRAVDDLRTLNKILYIRPPANIYSFNDLVSLWEKKIGKNLERIYISEEQLLLNIQEAAPPRNVVLAIEHSAFVKGDHTNFEIEPSFGVEATQLYPDVKYTTVDEFLNQIGKKALILIGISVMATKSKILIIGGTGYIGKFMVEASAKAGHPTFALVRETTLAGPSKANVVENFKNLAVNFLIGDVQYHESLVNAIKQVDVVISTISRAQLVDQVKIIAAIKEARNVKVVNGYLQHSIHPSLQNLYYQSLRHLRFFPSEFGNDVDRVDPVEPAKTAFATKAKIRRIVEAEGIPYTYVSSNFFADHYLSTFSQPGAIGPPREKAIIVGDGTPKVIYNKEDDIATYTIRAVDDPRTLNKILYIRPPANIYSFNDLVSLWEKKIGKTLERIYISEEQLLKNIQEAAAPQNVILAIEHSAYVKGDHTNFEIEPSFGVEATQLYPDVNYTTVDEYLNRLV